MKSLFSFIFLFLFANSAFAANLCDTSCNLTISFPSGGSIEATEALTFTFGTGGVLDLGATGTVNTAVQPASIDFSAGGSLSLAVGESITFDAGGSLDLGTGGAIDYTSITVTTDGVFDLQIDSVADFVYVGDIAIVGTGTLQITLTGSNLETGSLSTGGDLIITSTGSIDAVGVIVVSGATTLSGSTITATNVGNDFQGLVSFSSADYISLVDSSSFTDSCTTSSDGSLTISTTSSLTTSTCQTITSGGLITFSPVSLITASPVVIQTADIQLAESQPVAVDLGEGGALNLVALLFFVFNICLLRYGCRRFSIR